MLEKDLKEKESVTVARNMVRARRVEVQGMPGELLRASCSSLAPAQTSLEYTREVGCPTGYSRCRPRSSVKVALALTLQ